MVCIQNNRDAPYCFENDVSAADPAHILDHYLSRLLLNRLLTIKTSEHLKCQFLSLFSNVHKTERR